MMSTFYHNRQNDLDDTNRYAEALLSDKEDLMHKVSGWMLREAGKRDTESLEAFLVRTRRSNAENDVALRHRKFSPAKQKIFLSVRL